MNITFNEFILEDKHLLADFMTFDSWNFHLTVNMDRDEVLKSIEEGFYSNNSTRSFWIKDENEAVGFVRLFDLGKDVDDSETPLFDIKIHSKFRNKGIGCKAVKWLVDFVFTNYPNKFRIESFTRIDNTSMRKVLEKCGFVKEAQFRKSWRVLDSENVDTIGYGILKTDWLNNTVTPVEWDK
ncbi:MAG: N-acetyltransferase [Ignavibacteriae bacterium]|nr:MAG: N-acetyltransferase [Ignavibacteriota bacterium]